MPGGRDNREPGSSQPIDLVVRMIDALERSIERLQLTVREDFASQDELENVKLAVQHLRDEVTRLKAEIERDRQANKGLTDGERRLVRWFLYVGLPGGALALIRFGWDMLQKLPKLQP